jgi:hypothetical protein
MELYAMINMSTQFLVIGVLGIVFLACIYMLIRAILLLQAEKESRREEQYENIFKSEKASFLMLKKHFEDIEDKLDVIEELSKLPADEIVGTEKAIGKIIINRNRENAEAIINSNEVILDSFGGLKESIQTNNENLIDSYKSISEEQMQQMLIKQQEFFMGVKDMEIRLNNAIMQSQKIVAQAAPLYESPTVEQEAPILSDTKMDKEEASFKERTAEQAVQENIPDVTVGGEEEAAAEPESEATPVFREEETSAQEADVSDPNKKLESDEIESLFASISQEATESAPEEAPAEEQPAPQVDLSDPNKRMSADEIAALFSSMGA